MTYVEKPHRLEYEIRHLKRQRDELLDCYNRMTIHYHSLACRDEECAPLCKEAQALLRKIEK